MRFTLFSLAVTGLLITATPAVANHIPGHNNNDPVFPVPIPGQDHFSGGILFVTAIGPEAGTEITNTTFDITYVSDGFTPASDMFIEASIQLEDGFATFEVTGADLDFGSGPGTFTGEFSTDMLNGIVVGSFLPSSIVHLTIGSIQGGIDGTAYFEDSFIYFDVINVPAPAAAALFGCAAVVHRRRRR